MPEKEVSNLIVSKMIDNSSVNNYVPSDRTMSRYLNEVKVASALEGGISVAKVCVKKRMNRHTSENALCNALTYAIAVMSTHSIIGDELEYHTHDKLSDDAKNTIELLKRLNNAEKLRPIIPDQILGSDDTSLLTHTHVVLMIRNVHGK